MDVAYYFCETEGLALACRGVLVANAPAVELDMIDQLASAKRRGPGKFAGVDAGHAFVHLVVMVRFQEPRARGCPVYHVSHRSCYSMNIKSGGKNHAVHALVERGKDYRRPRSHCFVNWTLLKVTV